MAALKSGPSASEKPSRTPARDSAVRAKESVVDVDELTLHDRDRDEIIKEEREATRAAIHDPQCKEGEFPGDRGSLRSSLLLVGAICAIYASFGFVNSWGAFQSYYEQTLLKDSSASNIAWIGSIQYAFTFFPSIFTGRLFDLGYFKLPFSCASALLIAATFLTAQCTEYWQFLLCQGFAIGIASGAVFGPCVAVISHWYKKKRGLALGLMATGSSLGGTTIPIVVNKLVDQIGFPWTMRVIGFILLFTLVVANLTMDRRLPPVNVSGGLLNLRSFKNLAFSIYTASSFVAFLGLYTVLTYIDVSASQDGVDEDFSFYLLSIANAASLFGRISSGWLTDRYGAVNIMAPFTLIAGVMTYIWPFVHGKAAYIVVALIYGFSSGAYVSLIAAPIVALGETGDVGRRTGLFFFVLATGAIAGPPISGAINEATGGYSIVGIYAGTTVVIAVALMWISRCIVLGGMWGKF